MAQWLYEYWNRMTQKLENINISITMRSLNNLLYAVGNSEIHHQGVFATSNILHGTTIMSESPLLQSPDCDFFKNYKALNTHSLMKFNKLYSPAPRGLSSWSGLITQAAQKIWETNKFVITADEDAVFVETSRLNHSCNPNAEWLWREDTKTIEIVALRDIECGQEILISYLYFGEDSTAVARRLQLLDWKFICRCERCIAEGDQ